MSRRSTNSLALFLRVALAAGFLSAVADRFGWWGAPGTRGVAWGSFARFQAYTGRLTPWAPAALTPALAWTATAAEMSFSLLLLMGLGCRLAAAGAGVLLLSFAVGMSLDAGIKSPLDYSVFAAAGSAFALCSIGAGDWSLDAKRVPISAGSVSGEPHQPPSRESPSRP